MPTHAPTDGLSKTTTFSEGDAAPTETDQTPDKLHHPKKYKQNWRINLLSMPKNPVGKYTSPPDVFESGVNPSSLKIETPERIEHMSRPIIRTLVLNKRQYMPLHKGYEAKMDKRIDLSWNSIYNCYKKARRDVSRKSSTTSKRSRSSRGSKGPAKPAKEVKGGKKGGKGGKGDTKKGKEKGKKGKKEKKGAGGEKEKTEEDIEKAIGEWVELRSKPKPVFKPEPIARGPIADLIELKEKIDVLATPKKTDVVPPKDPTIIAEAALTYTPTERIIELARPPPFRLVKEEPFIPGFVKPEALQFTPNERIKKLATPKVTQSGNDTDVKEDPFAISPNALKYVATERIKELAKPIDR